MADEIFTYFLVSIGDGVGCACAYGLFTLRRQRIILTKLIQKKLFNMQQPQRFAPQSIPPGHMARFAQPAFSVLFISFDSD